MTAPVSSPETTSLSPAICVNRAATVTTAMAATAAAIAGTTMSSRELDSLPLLSGNESHQQPQQEQSADSTPTLSFSDSISTSASSSSSSSSSSSNSRHGVLVDVPVLETAQPSQPMGDLSVALARLAVMTDLQNHHDNDHDVDHDDDHHDINDHYYHDLANHGDAFHNDHQQQQHQHGFLAKASVALPQHTKLESIQTAAHHPWQPSMDDLNVMHPQQQHQQLVLPTQGAPQQEHPLNVLDHFPSITTTTAAAMAHPSFAIRPVSDSLGHTTKQPRNFPNVHPSPSPSPTPMHAAPILTRPPPSRPSLSISAFPNLGGMKKNGDAMATENLVPPQWIKGNATHFTTAAAAPLSQTAITASMAAKDQSMDSPASTRLLAHWLEDMVACSCWQGQSTEGVTGTDKSVPQQGTRPRMCDSLVNEDSDDEVEHEQQERHTTVAQNKKKTNLRQQPQTPFSQHSHLDQADDDDDDDDDDDELPGVLAAGIRYVPRRILVEGWLHKQGTGKDWIGSRAWKQRWARLAVARVEGYDAFEVPLLLIFWYPTSVVASTVILLESTVVLAVQSSRNKYNDPHAYQFEIRHAGSRANATMPVTRTFAAPQKARDAWVYSISQALLLHEKQKAALRKRATAWWNARFSTRACSMHNQQHRYAWSVDQRYRTVAPASPGRRRPLSPPPPPPPPHYSTATALSLSSRSKAPSPVGSKQHVSSGLVVNSQKSSMPPSQSLSTPIATTAAAATTHCTSAAPTSLSRVSSW